MTKVQFVYRICEVMCDDISNHLTRIVAMTISIHAYIHDSLTTTSNKEIVIHDFLEILKIALKLNQRLN